MSSKVEVNEVTINGQQYIRKDLVANATPVNADGLPYQIVRSIGAGVFAGWVKSRNGTEVEMLNARRLWYWDGAASLSQLAVSGVSKPKNCKFAVEVPKVTILNVCEILDVSEKARKSIESVPEWTV